MFFVVCLALSLRGLRGRVAHDETGGQGEFLLPVGVFPAELRDELSPRP
ncbi:MAG: hypothetical protein M3Q60_04510 [Actinomycetota bacterium]|nr:hypothetical protein [Actinomycetota bacterium]